MIGAVAGAIRIVISGVDRILPNWIGQATPAIITPAAEILTPGFFFSRLTAQLSAGLFLGFICVFLLVVFVAVLRSERWSLITLAILITTMGMLISDSSLSMLPLNLLGSFMFVFVLRRYGLLALIAAVFVAHLFVFYPMTTELTAWYAREFTIALGICVVLGAYAAYTSVGGAKVLGERV